MNLYVISKKILKAIDHDVRLCGKDQTLNRCILPFYMISEFKAVRICIVDPLHSNTTLFSLLSIMIKSGERMAKLCCWLDLIKCGGAT